MSESSTVTVKFHPYMIETISKRRMSNGEIKCGFKVRGQDDMVLVSEESFEDVLQLFLLQKSNSENKTTTNALTADIKDELLITMCRALMAILLRVENGNIAEFDQLDDITSLTKVNATRVFKALSDAFGKALEQREQT